MHNYRIDKVKLVAAMSVVFIHVTAFLVTDDLATNLNYYWYRYLLNFSVPFFFATTGYLIANYDLTALANYISKTLNLYIVLSLFYLLVDGVSFVITRMGLGETFSTSVLEFVRLKSWVNLLNGTFAQYHLWYLWALVVALLLIHFLLYFNLKPATILIISGFLYVTSLYTISQRSLLSVLANGGFPKAMFSIMIGYFVAHKQLKNRFGLIGFSILVSLFALVSLSHSAYFWSELLLLASIYWLMLFVNSSNGKASYWSHLSKDSFSIYLLHPVILSSYNYAVQLFPQLLINQYWLRIAVLFVVSILGSVILYPAFQRYFFSPCEQLMDKPTSSIVQYLTLTSNSLFAKTPARPN